MGAVSRGVRSVNGKVIGVIHETFVVDNQEDSDIIDMIVSKGPDLNERKQLLMDNGDAIIVMVWNSFEYIYIDITICLIYRLNLYFSAGWRWYTG